MTKEQFAIHLDHLQQAERQVREDGQKEYAHAAGNAFRNFEDTGREIQVDRYKVLWIFLKKHLDGVVSYMNGHRSQRESIHGRIKDARMYLALLDGMILEDELLGSLEPEDLTSLAVLLDKHFGTKDGMVQ